MREIHDFKPFVPSNDYAVSKAFYECMGFKINWDDGEVCEIDTKFGYRFLLLPRNHNGSKKLLSPKQQKNILNPVLPNQVYRNMKTVTIKADAEFDALLSRLARRMSTTKSRVIRDAVRNYQQHLDREALRQQMRNASIKTRNQALDASDDFDAANADGL